jgi:hypothetical protein
LISAVVTTSTAISWTKRLSRPSSLSYQDDPTINNDLFSGDLEKMIQTLGWIRFNQVANFLKRADRDPNSTDEVHETDTQMGIGFAIILYARLSGGCPDFCVDGPIIQLLQFTRRLHMPTRRPDPFGRHRISFPVVPLRFLRKTHDEEVHPCHGRLPCSRGHARPRHRLQG